MQITARSDRDLTPEGIVQKVADSSGSKYSAANQKPAGGPPPPVATKPVFMPTQSGSGGSGFNPLGGSRKSTSKEDVDEDGWGKDAPQVTRTQLEKVQSAYQPTKVNMRELSSRPQEPLKFPATQQRESGNDDVVKGAYQPIGKVDIAAIRRQAQEGRLASDDRPTTVKGSYEPVGKVDIAAIRARAQQPTGREDSSSARDTEQPKSLPDRSSAFTTSERLTSLPKPKVGNKFGSAAGTFGTKAPTPGGFGLDSKTSPSVPPVGASRTFADDGGRTPAQQWAEKKAKGGGNAPSQPSPSSFGVKSPIAAQTSGGEGWKSGYTGKSWATVQTSKPGHQAPAHDEGSTAQEAEPPTLAGDVGAMREMFKSSDISDRTPPGPPPLDTSNKPIARGVPIPGLFSQPSGGNEAYSHPKLPNPPPQPRSPTPPTPERSDSPIRVVKPVSNSQVPEVEDAHEEQYSPPPTIPVRSMAETVSQYAETPAAEESAPRFPDTGRAAGAAVAAATFGHETAAAPGAELSGKRALIQYDYEKAEDNELELREGEYVTNINMVDEDWWHGENQRGQSGLFPSNYVELVEDDGPSQQAPATTQAAAAEPAPGPAGGAGAVATALYDYEAAEDNELSFPEGAKISNVVSTITLNSTCISLTFMSGVSGRGLVVWCIRWKGRFIPSQLRATRRLKALN